MAFHYINSDNAIDSHGIRMTVVSGVPSPWGEAAKGFLHIKKLDWRAVRLNPRNEQQVTWTGQFSAPALMIDEERPLSSWDDILIRLDRYSSGPRLLPATDRTIALELCREICGIGGLGWLRRLQLMHAGFEERGGFSIPVAEYLAGKYGYDKKRASRARQQVSLKLNRLANLLRSKSGKAWSNYYLSDQLSCVDIYSATFSALFRPLPKNLCDMNEATRSAFEFDDELENEDDLEIILQHRDFIYDKYLETPLVL